MKNLPGWIQALMGIGAMLIVGLIGSTTSLMALIRNNDIGKMEQIIKVVEGQQKTDLERHDKIMEMVRQINDTNRTQNHVIDKICWLLTFDHGERLKLFSKYPMINPGMQGLQQPKKVQ